MDQRWRVMTVAGLGAFWAAAGDPEVVKLWPAGAPVTP